MYNFFNILILASHLMPFFFLAHLIGKWLLIPEGNLRKARVDEKIKYLFNPLIYSLAFILPSFIILRTEIAMLIPPAAFFLYFLQDDKIVLFLLKKVRRYEAAKEAKSLAALKASHHYHHISAFMISLCIELLDVLTISVLATWGI